MQDRNIKNYQTASIFVFILGCLGLLTVVALDKLFWDTSIFAEGWPNFSRGYLIRSFVICASTVTLCLALVSRNRPRLILAAGNEVAFVRLSILGTIFLSIICSALFIFEPTIFNTFSLEDGLIEWGSALLLFSGCVVVLISFLKFRRSISMPLVTKLSLVLLSFALFFIGMEEVSWFQRILEVQTPELFQSNQQSEMNLHNFATNYVENVYYFGTYIFFVMLAFIYLLPFVPHHDYLQLFIPRPFIAIIGTITCAYNFDMWNIIFTQIAFFSSVTVLLIFVRFSDNRTERAIIVFTAIFIAITQGLFLTNGANFGRLWAITEYKEFFIALVLLVYALDVFTRINRKYLPGKG